MYINSATDIFDSDNNNLKMNLITKLGLNPLPYSKYGNIYEKRYTGERFHVSVYVPARYNLNRDFEYENWNDTFDPDCHDIHEYRICVFDGDFVRYESGCPAFRASINVFNPKGENVTKSRMSRIY